MAAERGKSVGSKKIKIKKNKCWQQGPPASHSRERARGRGPQPSRKKGWAPGPKGRRPGESWRCPASEGLEAKWRVVRAPDGPLHLLVPPPSPLSPSRPLQASQFLMTTFYAASFRKCPMIASGCSHCPPTATPATGQDLTLCVLPATQHCGWLRQMSSSS